MFFKDRQTAKKKRHQTGSVVLQLSRGDESQGHGVIQQRPCVPPAEVDTQDAGWGRRTHFRNCKDPSHSEGRRGGGVAHQGGASCLSRHWLEQVQKSELYSLTEKATSLVWCRLKNSRDLGGGEYETPPRQPHKPDCGPAEKAGEQDHWARLLPVQKAGKRVPDWCIKVKVSEAAQLFHTRWGSPWS